MRIARSEAVGHVEGFESTASQCETRDQRMYMQR